MRVRHGRPYSLPVCWKFDGISSVARTLNACNVHPSLFETARSNTSNRGRIIIIIIVVIRRFPIYSGTRTIGGVVIISIVFCGFIVGADGRGCDVVRSRNRCAVKIRAKSRFEINNNNNYLRPQSLLNRGV